jgi:hypothetical protein
MTNDSGKTLPEGTAREPLSDPGEVFQRILGSEGERVHWQMQALAAAYFVFEGNSRELLLRIGQVENREAARRLWDMDNRENFNLIQKGTMRLVHNFLAGAFTLIEHTRVVTRELYKRRAFEREYDAKLLEVFAKSDLASVVKGLRHWMTHRGPVPVSFQLTFPDGASKCSVVLDLAQLKLWDGWTGPAKNYIPGLTASPPLRAIVEQYVKLVEGFYLWLQLRMEEIHAAAFLEARKLRERLEELHARDNR